MELSASAKLLVRAAVVLLIGAACAGVWEVFTLQPPSSQWGVNALTGPVKQLRETCTVFGLCFVALAWLIPWISPDKAPKILLGVLLSGVALTLLAATYGATTGMHGVQIHDPRPDSQALFWVKSVGQLVVFGCLVEIGRRLLFVKRAAP